MSFLEKNNIFQKGNFDGYSVEGRCAIAQKFEHVWEQSAILPGIGQNMAVLDNPNLINSDGERLSSASLPANALTPPATAKTFNTSDIIFADSLGQITRGSDGACLEIENIKIKAGQIFSMRWNFVRYDDRLDMNDFVMVEIRNSETDELIKRDFIIESAKLKSADSLLVRWSTGWQPFSWFNSLARKINLKVVVSNGYTFSGAQGPDPLQTITGRAFPSGLLIDGFFLN